MTFLFSVDNANHYEFILFQCRNSNLIPDDCVSILCQSTVSYVTNDMYTLLLQTLNEHYKTAEISGEKIDISFLKSSITLLIPDEGVLVKGWKITCFTSKTVNKSLKVKVN